MWNLVRSTLYRPFLYSVILITHNNTVILQALLQKSNEESLIASEDLIVNTEVEDGKNKDFY